MAAIPARAWYAEQNWEELERRAVAHVNVDSTGGKGNTVVADTTAAAELRGVAREAIRDQGGQDFSEPPHGARRRPVVLGHRRARRSSAT